LLRQSLGEDAVVLSTKPCAEGVEILAMAPESMRQIERMAHPAEPDAEPAPRAAAPRALLTAERQTASAAEANAAARSALAAKSAARARERTEPSFGDTLSPAAAAQHGVDQDVQKLAMSTLSFQDYVRERVIKRSAAKAQAATHPRDDFSTSSAAEDADRLSASTLSFQDYARNRMLKKREAELKAQAVPVAPTRAAAPGPLSSRMAEREAAEPAPRQAPARREPPVLRDEVQIKVPRETPREPVRDEPRRSEARPNVPREAARQDAPQIHIPTLAERGLTRQHDREDREDRDDMMNELKSMKGLIEERFGALAFMEKLQRQPGQARLTQKLLDCGFSPALIRKLADSLPSDAADESAWAAGVLERNLLTDEGELALEDQGGVFALVGATGVGKTTTTAKIAAAFATKYGAAHLGLITLDAYRVGAHEQLRAYGRILGVPVHTAHDRASLEDLLELLAAKKMVLIDTAGMAQRDSRTRELLEMLSHRAIQKVLVVNAASQGETIEDVLIAYGAPSCKGIVLSKLDEAVKLGPAIDTLIRHRLKVIGVANGQRVPEDWHRLSSNALVHRALRGGGSSAYKLDSSDVNLIFAASNRAADSRSALRA
jgi:flagellar biosynthesis protein FlhF